MAGGRHKAYRTLRGVVKRGLGNMKIRTGERGRLWVLKSLDRGGREGTGKTE